MVVWNPAPVCKGKDLDPTEVVIEEELEDVEVDEEEVITKLLATRPCNLLFSERHRPKYRLICEEIRTDIVIDGQAMSRGGGGRPSRVLPSIYILKLFQRQRIDQ